MNNFYISVSNGLLTEEHRNNMGSAVWQFMWILDKITKIDDNGVGWVLGGKPIKLKEMSFGLHDNTVSANISALEKSGYIQTKRTPYGMTIKVMKAKKRFNKSTELLDKKKRFTKNSDSQKTVERFTENSGLDSLKTVDTKKIVSVDNTVDNKKSAKADEKPFNWIEYRAEMLKSEQRHIRVISAFFQKTGKEFSSSKEVQAAIKVHLRAAMQVGEFNNPDILKCIRLCQEMKDKAGQPIRFNLWTVLKELTK